jgi:hypothetical protein
MTRFRLIGVTLLAMFALGAVVAASVAQATEAPYWTINGTRLAKGATKYVSAKTYKESELNLEAGSKKVKCTKTKVPFEGAVLLGSSAGEPGTSSETFEYSGCKVEGNGSECKVKEPIVTSQLRSELAENSSEYTLVELKPVSGATVATLGFEGGACTIKETKVTGSVAAEVLTTAEQKIKMPTEHITGESWIYRFPTTAIKSVVLFKEGKGETVEVGLTAFGESAKAAGTAQISLAEVKEGKLFSSGEVVFEQEKGWKGEAKGGGDFQITENAKVSCEKETFEGVGSGDSATSDMAPSYSGCQFEVENEKKEVTKTSAKVEARGCDYEELAAEEPGKDEFKTEFDISNCSAGKGILITSELEAGKTCEVEIGNQADGKGDKDKDTKEGAPFESEGEIHDTDVAGVTKGCPEGIEKGKEPSLFMSMVLYVPVFTIFGWAILAIVI